jgi:hypothetical protein
MLSFSISYRDLIKFHYFADTIERGIGGEGDRDLMDNFIIVVEQLLAASYYSGR